MKILFKVMKHTLHLVWVAILNSKTLSNKQNVTPPSPSRDLFPISSATFLNTAHTKNTGDSQIVILHAGEAADSWLCLS